MANVIVCGRLDNSTSFSPPSTTPELRRIVSENPGAMKKPVYCPIATDGEKILHVDGISDAASFLETFSSVSGARLLVLTMKERLLLLEKAALCGVAVRVFEVDYPIMGCVTAGRSLRVNFDILRKLLKKVDQLDIRSGSFAQDQTTRHLYSVARKLRFKNTLDQNFFFAYKEGYQEVFKLKEERPDRAIIAFDFNSMYADCMNTQFCEPRTVQYVSFADRHVEICDLNEGIYRVTLGRAKPGFFLEKHPFLYKRLGASHRFKLAADDSIETVLFTDEIKYYEKFFLQVEIHEGFFSAVTVLHPLLQSARDFYGKRHRSKARGDVAMENYCKLSLQLMHSATNKRIFKKKSFDCVGDVLGFLAMEFHLNFDGVEPSVISRFLAMSKYFSVDQRGDQMVLKYLDIRADSLLFSLSAKIVATARLKLMKTMERFILDGAAEICYANVDSLHVSVAKSDVDGFLERHKDLISTELGSLKVQAVADRGYWFDVGRYWLKADDEVVLFRNVGFNHKGASTEFITKKRMHVVRNADAFVQVSSYLVNISKCFSWSKRIRASNEALTLDYERYEYSDIATPEMADRMEAAEIMNSKQLKVDLFRAISGKEDGVVDFVWPVECDA